MLLAYYMKLYVLSTTKRVVVGAYLPNNRRTLAALVVCSRLVSRGWYYQQFAIDFTLSEE